jgi:hypothetical protein
VSYDSNGILRCDMTHNCAKTVTHIDEKGFVYCREHGIVRKCYRRCRQLFPNELRMLREYKPISYDPKRNRQS